MATITKLELTQINSRLAEDNLALRDVISQLELNLKLKDVEINKLKTKTEVQKQGTFETPEVAARKQAMKEARAIAMSTGKTTKVQ